MNTPKKPVAAIIARRLTYAIAFAYAVCAIFRVSILDIGWLGAAKTVVSLIYMIPIPLVAIVVSILTETILIRRWLKTVSGESGRKKVEFELLDLSKTYPRLRTYNNSLCYHIVSSPGSPATMKMIEWVRKQLDENPGWINCEDGKVLFKKSALSLRSHEVEYWMELNEIVDEAIVEQYRKTDSAGNTSKDRMKKMLDNKSQERKERDERKNKKKAEGKEV